MFWFDSAILAAVLLGAGLGFWSGLLWQVARLVSLGVAIYTSVAYSQEVSDYLVAQVFVGGDPLLWQGISYIGLFLIVYFGLFLIAQLLQAMVKAARLELMDRCLGALLGLTKMTLLVAVICTGLNMLPLPQTEEWLEKSKFAPPLLRAAEATYSLVPGDYRLRITDQVHQVREAVERKMQEPGNQANHQGPKTLKSVH